MVERVLPANANLIPAGAELKFHGVVFDVYQWQQKMYDGSFATFEMLKRPDTVVVIALDDDDKLVTIDEEQPHGYVKKGGLPVGGSESYDSSMLEAAQRECLEETGLEFNNWKLLEVRQPEQKIEWFIYVYGATSVKSQREQNLDAGERITVTRTDYEKFFSRNIFQQQLFAKFPTAQHFREFVESQS